MRLVTIAGWLLAGTSLARAAAVATGAEPASPPASSVRIPGTDTITSPTPRTPPTRSPSARR